MPSVEAGELFLLALAQYVNARSESERSVQNSNEHRRKPRAQRSEVRNREPSVVHP